MSCAAVLSPEHALYSVQRAARGVCEGISLNDDGGSSGVCGRERKQTHLHMYFAAAVILQHCVFSS